MNHDVKSYIESDEIQSFIEDHPDHYLANVFIPDSSENNIEVGIYNRDDEEMKTFTAEGIETSSELARTGRPIEKLDITKDLLSFSSAVNHARAEVDTAEPLTRIMGVLQKAEGPTWTITLITKSYTVHTVRLQASTGKHIETTSNSMMSWVKNDT